jgi:hypothetical protein
MTKPGLSSTAADSAIYLGLRKSSESSCLGGLRALSLKHAVGDLFGLGQV